MYFILWNKKYKNIYWACVNHWTQNPYKKPYWRQDEGTGSFKRLICFQVLAYKKNIIPAALCMVWAGANTITVTHNKIDTIRLDTK